jgi:diacylglycerol kinase family enzyme
VFIGNNAYDVSLFTVRGRPRLDGGQLGLYTANRPGRFGLVRITIRALLGRLRQERDFDAALLEEAWIETGKSRLHVALDGEVRTLKTPLHVRTLPGALRVFAP